MIINIDVLNILSSCYDITPNHILEKDEKYIKLLSNSADKKNYMKKIWLFIYKKLYKRRKLHPHN